MTVKRKLHLYRSPWKRLSSPTLVSNRLRGATREGLWSESFVPGAGRLKSLAPTGGCPAQTAGVRGFANVATLLPQKRPIAICWSASSDASTVGKSATNGELATSPLSYRQLKAIHGSELSKRLLKARVELVALAGADRRL